jgi:hypothetical protein
MTTMPKPFRPGRDPWPTKVCRWCGRPIRLVLLSGKWKAYDDDSTKPHRCAKHPGREEETVPKRKVRVLYSAFETNRRRH